MPASQRMGRGCVLPAAAHPSAADTTKASEPMPSHFPILAALATLELSAAWAASELPPGVWGETTLVPYCLAGSVLGGLLAVGVVPANDTTRRLAVKGSCSAISGLLFTDILMGYYQIPLTKGNVIGTAGAVAFMAVAALTPLIAIAVPKWERFVRKRADALSSALGVDSTQLPTQPRDD